MVLNKAAYRAAIAKRKAAAKTGSTAMVTMPKSTAFQKAVNDAVKKAEQKSHETYYCNFGVTFDTSVQQQTGSYAVGGFQATVGAAPTTMANFFGNTSMAHVLNIPCQISVGTNAGYRKGQFINPIGLRMWVRGYMSNATCPHDLHFAIVRNKTNTIPATVQQYPSYGTMGALSLFETGAFGPNSSSFITGGQRAEYTDATRFNRDIWDVKKVIRQNVLPVPTQELSNTNNQYRRLIQIDAYYPFPDNTWDFTSNTSGSIKGGDYYLIMWNQNGEPSSSGTPIMVMQVNMELSFKDA